MQIQFFNFLKKVIRSKYYMKEYEGRDIWLRNNNIDNQVYDYVFSDKYHRPDRPLISNPPVILDLGVNIGLTIVDFKNLYPAAIIYGYELDKDNAAMAWKNTAGLHDVFIFNQGVWHTKQLVSIAGSDPDALKIDEPKSNGHNLVSTLTMNDIVAEHKLHHIDYIKMDIEGAEYEVFQKDLQWLDITDQIKVEIHNGREPFDFIRAKLDQAGFITAKDTHHWSTIIGYKK
jgi:FkbM family methyltransferase